MYNFLCRQSLEIYGFIVQAKYVTEWYIREGIYKELSKLHCKVVHKGKIDEH